MQMLLKFETIKNLMLHIRKLLFPHRSSPVEVFVTQLSSTIIQTINSGNKIIIIGNGGSMCESSHFAGELMCKMTKERKPLPAIALSDIGVSTAISNDFGFVNIFSRQIDGLGVTGDLLITLSTSGKSPNIIKAIKVAKKKNLKVVSFPTNKELSLPTSDTQSVHLNIIHVVSQIVEDYYEEEDK